MLFIVNVAPTDLMDEAVYELEKPIVNKSLQGKILILKEGSQDEPIGGAVFKIYPKDDQVECDHTNCDHEVDTVVIGEDGYGLSKLLDIGDYDVVEVQVHRDAGIRTLSHWSVLRWGTSHRSALGSHRASP